MMTGAFVLFLVLGRATAQPLWEAGLKPLRRVKDASCSLFFFVGDSLALCLLGKGCTTAGSSLRENLVVSATGVSLSW